MSAISAFTTSSSFRVGAVFTVLSLGAGFFIVYFWTLASDEIFLREAKAALHAERYGFETVHHIGGLPALTEAIDGKTALENNTTLIALSDSKGKVVAGNLVQLPAIPLRPEMFTLELDIAQLTGASRGTSYVDTHSLLISVRPVGDAHSLLLARNVDDLYDAQWFGRTLSWIFIGLLAVIAGLSYWVAWYVVNRINRMSQTATKIMQTGSLKERLEIDSNWDDLSKLALVFNRMLDKIEVSFTNVKAVTDNIAHDLRTPLSRLRSRLELVADPALRKQTLAETDNMLSMFNGLLRIGDIESHRQRSAFTTVDLHLIIEDVISLYLPLAELKEISLTADLEAVSAEGDRDLLFQAVANVLDNAIKYGCRESTVKVSLKAYSAVIGISIEDSGEGVSSEEFENLERRFFRAERSRTTQGNGLGLSLVAAVVALHQGHVWFVDRPLLTPTGLGVVITLSK